MIIARVLSTALILSLTLSATRAQTPTTKPADQPKPAKAEPVKTEPAKPADKPAANPNPKSVSGDYDVDPIHSSNVFRIRHMNVANFYGRFNEMAGTFKLDLEKPEASSFDIRIKTASIDTANADRDKHLRADDMFDAEKYPEITFKSKTVKAADAQTWTVAGELTFHGVTKPLTVQLTTPVGTPGRNGQFVAGFETTFDIKRSDFGMTNAIGPLGDDVRIMVSVEGVRK